MYNLKPTIKKYLQNKLSPSQVEFFNLVLYNLENPIKKGCVKDILNIFHSEFIDLYFIDLVNTILINNIFYISVNPHLFTDADWENKSFDNDIYHYINE